MIVESPCHETSPVFLAGAVLAALLITGPAHGQMPPCSPRPEVVEHLGKKYAETPVAMGLANNGGVIEVLASPDGSSWTIIITMPNGAACLVAAGEFWTGLPVKADRINWRSM